MVNVGIAGASGYTGVELLRLLLRHPEVQLTVLTSETYQGRTVSEVFPSLSGLVDAPFVPLESEALDRCDVLFLALPHTTAMRQVPRFLKAGRRVIDLSADYRLNDPAAYEQWYRFRHEHPELLKEAVYGLPELHRDRIREAKLVANPGCYPTSIVLALAPLLSTDWGDADSIIADCKSGVSGAGRKTALPTQFAECNESVSAYGLTTHRHTPEIEQEVSALAGRDVRLSFSPHLMPMTRGMLSTIYVNLQKEVPPDTLAEHYRAHYQNERFVRVLPPGASANTHFVKYSNYCDLGLAIDPRTRRVILTSAIDNLVKGASGQAVQNMNLMLGLDEATALEAPGLFP
ncbi:MAG: N-acetyl-gamma-glutamyl-phosphate reductase [Nitrospinaceae bacterium]|nr:N-acetyl-gamma-glutamyl-phosphate reductase [Nitrospinaceae bacterium]NIS84091.1 N-acetyl-gamma-glutamyl-phosphate reductase [Nitrospinaceae bacterium]